ncbi:uncharacterized protein LOC132295571 [Cornus florida]|uniref:uncharacterized protein LOC132295571 n=1 Tax=Cornus florida TaxID=4283 RepID=UPI0028A0628A|nr:uncharacterized protein LOC132295571 [Cornus florida]
MVGVVPGEGQKRQLPLWMLGVGVTDQSKENANVNNDNNINKPDANERIASKPSQPKSIKAGKEPPVETDSCLPATRETKRRKRKLSQSIDGDCDSNICENGMAKKKNVGVRGALVKVSAPRKGRKAKSSTVESSEDVDNPSPSDDEGELTVEDLMSIAKEYIETDKDTDQQQLLDRKQEEECQWSATSFSTDRLEGSLNVPQCSRKLPMPKETTFTENSTKEGIISNPITGDPTQDMLDLFLGPLLNKPLEEEKKVESIVQDLTFSYELKIHNQNDVLGEELVPLTKKKSSLKDKVAFFLD